MSALAININENRRTDLPSSPVCRLSSVVCRLCFAKASQGRPSSAFTLVELLVVVVVLAILASITLPLFRYTMTRINQSKQNIMLDQIKSALEDYRAAYGEYPITPNASLTNPDDVRRHYPDTLDVATFEPETVANSPFINVAFNGVTTVEQCFSNGTIYIDYCLTYPLVIKQELKGANPFIEFPRATVFYMVYRSTHAADSLFYTSSDKVEVGRVREGGLRTITTPGGVHSFIYGNPVKRYKAVDPISGKQWKYECTNGLNYSLTLNSF